ncbi:hypothetical protein PS914_00703 [Pseudomonas fluorescens]|uniref:GNAT family N-acetyltransferase n=1 Tax=Pseudomonas fluorescens TaxID=294 RepID=UPI00123F2C73|nr:GNAT family N-acetyltransferase [Pseudomonas fluorescens]VVP68420.1 hypothetical protein PS914_00703 [Pseudomonas fluorescens]
MVGTTIIEQGKYKVVLIKWENMLPHLDALYHVRYDALESAGIKTNNVIDKYDERFEHLLAFENNQLFGSYRIKILNPGEIQNFGPSGSLFEIPADLPIHFEKAAEIGRAVILPSHQKKHHSLLILWRAIAKIVLADPSIRFVFGPITLDPHLPTDFLHLLIKATSDFASTDWLNRIVPLLPIERESIAPHFNHNASNFKELTEILKALKIHPPLPILLRQYYSFGANFSPFGRWLEYGNAYVSLACLKVEDANIGLLK